MCCTDANDGTIRTGHTIEVTSYEIEVDEDAFFKAVLP